MENTAIETGAAIETRAIFTTNAAALYRAAAYLAGKIADKHGRNQVVAAVRIEAQPDGLLTLTATDCDLFASIELQADVQSPGAFCTNAKNFAAMLGKARKGREFVTLDDSGERPVMKAGRVRFNMKREALLDFPCHPIRGTESALSGEYELSAAQFVADIGAAAKCMETSGHRAYLQGVAIQRRDLAGRDRLVIVGCDGSNMAIASRAAPDGLGEWKSEIVPARAALAIIAGAKLAGEADAVTVSRLQTERRGLWASFALGNLTIETKLSDFDYPDWTKAAGPAAAETSQQSPALFPELLPAYPAAALEKIGKGAPGAITWAAGETSLVGTLADDADMMFVAMMGGGGAPEGYSYDWSDSKALEYLHGLVASRGLPDADELNRRAAAINEAWGENCGYPVYSKREIQHGKAGEASTSRVYLGNEIVGLTIEATETRFERCETVKDWETLSERETTTPREIVPVEGSYSVLMPGRGPQREAAVILEIEGDRSYPVATNGAGKIHLSAAQVRAACGESVFEVMQIPAADGGKRYVSAWLYRDGATRLLCVGKDGRCPGVNDRREYLTREQVDAALAGDAAAIDATPIGETEPAALIAGIAAAVPSPEIAPQSAPEPIAPAVVPEIPEIDASGPEIAEAGQDMPGAGALDAFAARLAAVEALLAALPGELATSAQAAHATLSAEPKRTPAHERAIRRAWAERAARIKAVKAHALQVSISMDQLENARKSQRMWQEQAEQWGILEPRLQAKRRANALLARKRTRELVFVGKVLHDMHDEASAKLERAKMSPTYFDGDTGAERLDLAGRNAVIAQDARVRSEMLERALAGANQRCEQMERALGNGAAIIEKMGTELANARAELRTRAAA